MTITLDELAEQKWKEYCDQQKEKISYRFNDVEKSCFIEGFKKGFEQGGSANCPVYEQEEKDDS